MRPNSILVVVDVQQRLGDVMPGKVLNRVLVNTQLLARAAGLLDIPVFKTEQYPRGLGPTHPTITEVLPSSTRAYEKLTFSCCRADGFLDEVMDLGRRQMILVGMEAHVCVLQTAVDLQGEGLEAFVVEDAVCSRRLENYQNALDRLRQSQVADRQRRIGRVRMARRGRSSALQGGAEITALSQLAACGKPVDPA